MAPRRCIGRYICLVMAWWLSWGRVESSPILREPKGLSKYPSSCSNPELTFHFLRAAKRPSTHEQDIFFVVHLHAGLTFGLLQREVSTDCCRLLCFGLVATETFTGLFSPTYLRKLFLGISVKHAQPI